MGPRKIIRCFAVLCIVSIVANASLAPSQDEVASPGLPDAAAETSDLDRWIHQLDSDAFAERRAATQKLFEMGSNAVSALADIASSELSEAGMRAIDILKRHARSDNSELQSSATEALTQIANNEHARLASSAREALRPQTPASLNRFGPGFPQIGGGFPQGAAGPIPRRGITRQVSRSSKGIRDTEIEDGTRKIKIHEEPAGDISVEITVTEGDKPTTRRFEAKNADELKQKSTEAHQLYEAFGKPSQANAANRANPQNGAMFNRTKLIALQQQLNQLHAQTQNRMKNARTPAEVADLQTRLQRYDQSRQEIEAALRQLP